MRTWMTAFLCVGAGVVLANACAQGQRDFPGSGSGGIGGGGGPATGATGTGAVGGASTSVGGASTTASTGPGMGGGHGGSEETGGMASSSNVSSSNVSSSNVSSSNASSSSVSSSIASSAVASSSGSTMCLPDGSTCASPGSCCSGICSGGQCGGPCQACGTQCCQAGEKCCTPPPAYLCVPQSGFCPVSRRAYKDDIRYLTDDEVQALHDELVQFPLARWRYKSEARGGAEHVGFILEDVEPSPAADSAHDMADLYGYTSMAVAAIQAQERRIQDLEKEMERLRSECAAQRAP